MSAPIYADDKEAVPGYSNDKEVKESLGYADGVHTDGASSIDAISALVAEGESS
jgi:hypothetical protein